jgi:hypothetical protein
MTVALKSTSVLNTCGLITDNPNLLLDVGKLQSAPATVLTGCLMEEPSNGSVTPSQHPPLMAWTFHTDWKELMSLILKALLQVAFMMKTALIPLSALSSCGTVLKMENHTVMDLLATTMMLEFAQLRTISPLLTLTTGEMMELASVLTPNSLALHLWKLLRELLILVQPLSQPSPLL